MISNYFVPINQSKLTNLKKTLSDGLIWEMDLSACACGEGLGQVVHLRSAIGVLIVFLNNLQI